MNPFHEDDRKRAIGRGTHLLEHLRAHSVLSAADFEMALQQIRDIHLPAVQVRPSNMLHVSRHEHHGW